MKDNDDVRYTNVRWDPDKFELVKSAADRNGLSISGLIRLATLEWVAKSWRDAPEDR